MDAKTLENLRSRTDAKLRYSAVHLKEIQALEGHGGHDFDRAHQESFLYHLLGAKDAFLQELNVYYNTGLHPEAVTAGRLRDVLLKNGKQSEELARLYILENDENSWLSQAKAMRDHATHISGVPRTFHIGGKNDGNVFLKNPKSGVEVTKHFPERFVEWFELMHQLIEDLRECAIKTNFGKL